MLQCIGRPRPCSTRTSTRNEFKPSYTLRASSSSHSDPHTRMHPLPTSLHAQQHSDNHTRMHPLPSSLHAQQDLRVDCCFRHWVCNQIRPCEKQPMVRLKREPRSPSSLCRVIKTPSISKDTEGHRRLQTSPRYVISSTTVCKQRRGCELCVLFVCLCVHTRFRPCESTTVCIQ